MLKQETFYEVQSWGCVSALLGLPAELIPQMFVPCLTTGVIIPALCRIVNHFRKIFSRNFKKQNPRTEQSPILCGGMCQPFGFPLDTNLFLFRTD